MVCRCMYLFVRHGVWCCMRVVSRLDAMMDSLDSVPDLVVGYRKGETALGLWQWAGIASEVGVFMRRRWQLGWR